jgi:hypothetical protein
MSAARWLPEFGKLGLSLIGSLLGWILIAPLASIVPKRRDWIAVIGRQHGKFLDNAKHFYVQACSSQPGLRCVFITERSDTLALFAGSTHEVLRYPSVRSIWFLMRCASAVVDSTDWIRHLRRFFLVRARVLQIWHGVGFKRIELDKWRNEAGRYRWFSNRRVFSLRIVFYRITGRLIRYAAVCSTSTFYRDEVFRKAFLAERYPITGYPRNAFGTSIHSKMLWWNVDQGLAERLDDWTRQGRKTAIVAPTIRDSGTAPMQLTQDTAALIDEFAEANGWEFVFKFHPSERNAGRINGRHLHVCHPDSDVYPLLPKSCALITDYSSIYMDYLLLHRPVLFFIPTADTYLQADREVQFDISTMMPGPVASDWPGLLASLTRQLVQDGYAAERERVRTMAFDDQPQESAVPMILELIRDR